MRLDSGISLQQEMGWNRKTLHMARYLAKTQSEPFVVSSLSNIGEQLKTWKANFPSIQPTYNVGGNHLSEVLHCIQDLGVTFNISNKRELSKLVELGCNMCNTYYTNCVSPRSHVRAAAAAGVNLFYCDSPEELVKIKNLHGTARIVLQLRCEESMNSGQLGDTDGVNIVELPNILQTAKQENLDIVGIALNLNITNKEENLNKFQEAIKISEAAVHIGSQQDFKFSMLHLGQFFSGVTLPSSQYVKGVQKILQSSTLDGLQLSADATQFLVSSSVTLAAKIIAVRERKLIQCMQYYINEGVFGAFSNNLISEDGLVPTPLPLGGGKKRKGLRTKMLDSSIVGPSGDELDEVLEDIALQRMEEGDWLLFPNMGIMNFNQYSSEMKIEGNNLFIYLKN